MKNIYKKIKELNLSAPCFVYIIEKMENKKTAHEKEVYGLPFMTNFFSSVVIYEKINNNINNVIITNFF